MKDMKANIVYGIRLSGISGLLGLAAVAGLFPFSATAATRTAYFNQSGLNKTVNGLAENAQSICRITINNPSNQPQSYTVSINISSLDSWNGGDSGTPVSGSYDSSNPSAGATAPSGCPSCSGSLPAGETIQVNYVFSTYPKRNHSTTPVQGGYQKLRCSGSIVATDTAQPGFLVASGVLVTFVESTKMSTDGVTGGSTQSAQFGGMAVYTQVPVTINRGKPF